MSHFGHKTSSVYYKTIVLFTINPHLSSYPTPIHDHNKRTTNRGKVNLRDMELRVKLLLANFH